MRSPSQGVDTRAASAHVRSPSQGVDTRAASAHVRYRTQLGESAPNPATRRPDPVARELGVIPGLVGRQVLQQTGLVGDQPALSGAQIRVIYRPVAPPGYLIGVRLQRAPDVGDETVRVTNCLDVLAGAVVGAGQQNGARAEERLQVRFTVPEGSPHDTGDQVLASEIGEWGLGYSIPTTHQVTCFHAAAARSPATS